MADARSFSANRSPMDPPPHAIGALPEKPAAWEISTDIQTTSSGGVIHTEEAEGKESASVWSKRAPKAEGHREDVADM